MPLRYNPFTDRLDFFSAGSASFIANDSSVAGATVRDALNTLNAKTVVESSRYYVDGNLGIDLTADGTLMKPFQTIQACLNFLGQPINRIDALRHIEIHISDKSSITGSLFGAIYTENLTVPNRFITMYGSGVKIDGNILKEYSSSRRFGASSSEFRPCLTLVGVTESRDSHPRIRTAFHVGGSCRTAILKRNFDSIQGNGSNKVTVHLTPGQFTYPITIPTDYPTNPYIRILISGTTNYNATYDITSKINDTTFEATRVSGTNANIGIEVSGSFFESDSAGASGITHDSSFINTYMQGAYTCDDGTVNSSAPTAGTEVMFAIGSRFFTGIEGRTVLCQRWENNTVAGAYIISSIAGMNNCSLSGTITLSTFTYGTDDMGFMNCRFNSAVPITVSSAGQTVRMDGVSYASFLTSGSTWITNTPTVSILDLKRFASGVRTSTGSAESIPHGLAVIPNQVLVSIYDLNGAASAVIVEGTHTSTNVIVTVTVNVKYKVMAFI